MKLLFFILFSALVGYFGSQTSNLSQNENVLIKVDSKLYNYGFIIFIILEHDKPIKRIVFPYSYNKQKEVTIIGNGNSVIGADISSGNYMNTEDFFEEYNDTKMSEVLCAIDERFLQLSNKEKLSLLNNIVIDEGK